jgi:hypothetical protein
MNFKSFSILTFAVFLICATLFAQKSGEIVFSKKMINPESPSGLTNEFQPGDNIYSTAFFDKSILDLCSSGNAKKVDLEVFLYELKPPLYDYQQPSEVQMETSTLKISGEALQRKFLPVDIVPSADEMTAYGNDDLTYKKFGSKFDGPVKFAEAMNKLEAGQRKIIVKLRCNYNFVAEGKFTIKGDDYSAYKKMANELNESADNAKTKSAIMPKSALSDKKLEADMIKAFKNSQTYKDRIKGDILRIAIIDPDWTIRRHEVSGRILHRYIRAAIAVKNSDGTCTVWQLVTFQQDYVSNKFQKTRFDGIGDPYKIPCENVNK